MTGWKTYACAAAFMIAQALEAAGVLARFDPALVHLVEMAFATMGAAALRHGVQKAEDKAAEGLA